LPAPGQTRWRCQECSASYDEPTGISAERKFRCPVCWAGRPHWSQLVELADGSAPCPDCQALILWLITDRNRLMPVDAQPSPRGNVARQGRHGGVLNPRQATVARGRGVPLYLHHRLTCPHADRWAKTRG
jgi:DNA-directed RNA polymerase subunit RPC12/RpoP